MKKSLWIFILLIIFWPLFSQDNDLFLRYSPGTNSRNIIANEGDPDSIVLGEETNSYKRYHYNNKYVNGYNVNISYVFIDDILVHTGYTIIISDTIIFSEKNEETIRNIFENIYNYYNENYGQSQITEKEGNSSYSIIYEALWKIRDIPLGIDTREYIIITMQLPIPPPGSNFNNRISYNNTYILISHTMIDP
jgi:hypothetical protein